MPFKNLESKVVREIDSLDIGLSYYDEKPVEYSSKLNYLLYGPGIDAVRKICDSYENSTIPQTDFLGLEWENAKEEFTKQYLLHHLEKNDYYVKKMAQSLKISTDSLRKYFSAYKIKIKELRKAGKREKSHLFNPLNIAKKTIESYQGLFGPKVLNTFLKKKKNKLAQRFSKVALEIINEEDFSKGLYSDEYFKLPLSWAKKKFKKDYFDLKVERHKRGGTKEIAKAIGKSPDSTGHFLQREGIKLRDLSFSKLINQ